MTAELGLRILNFKKAHGELVRGPLYSVCLSTVIEKVQPRRAWEWLAPASPEACLKWLGATQGTEGALRRASAPRLQARA